MRWQSGNNIIICASILFGTSGFGAFGQTPPQNQQPDILTLEQALRLAAQNNRRLKISNVEVERAQQRVSVARSLLFPGVNLQARGGQLIDTVSAHFPAGVLGSAQDGSPLPSKSVDIKSSNRVTSLIDASIAQPLTQLPKIRMGIQLQGVGLNIAREQVREQRQSVTALVKQLYYQMLQMQSAIEAGEENLRSLIELERTIGDFVAQKTALESDLLNVSTHRAQQELGLLTLCNSLAQAKEQMNILLGRPLETLFQVTAATETVARGVEPDALRARALQSRPDLRQASLQIKRAQLDRNIKQQEFIPELSLAMNYYQIGNGIDGLPDHLWTVGFQVSWNVFDWGRRRSEVAEKGRAIVQAQAALQESRERAINDVNSQMRKLSEAEEQLRVRKLGLKAAEEKLREVLEQFKVKAALLKDALEAQSARAAAWTQLYEANLQLLIARTDLAKAVGEDQ